MLEHFPAMNTPMVFWSFIWITHFLMSTDVILVLYMSSREFALPMFVYFDYCLFRWWCSIAALHGVVLPFCKEMSCHTQCLDILSLSLMTLYYIHFLH